MQPFLRIANSIVITNELEQQIGLSSTNEFERINSFVINSKEVRIHGSFIKKRTIC